MNVSSENIKEIVRNVKTFFPLIFLYNHSKLSVMNDRNIMCMYIPYAISERF